jgi:hypothetical protein
LAEESFGGLDFTPAVREVSFGEAVAADARRRNKRGLREFLADIARLRGDGGEDAANLTAEELACAILAGLRGDLGNPQEVASCLLARAEGTLFRIESDSLRADLAFFSGAATSDAAGSSEAVRLLVALDRIMARESPDEDCWRAIIRSEDRSRFVDEAIDRGLPVPTEALDRYAAARLSSQAGDPREAVDVWEEAEELAELREAVAQGDPSSLTRLRELHATPWADDLFLWLQAGSNRRLPDDDLLAREGLWRVIHGQLARPDSEAVSTVGVESAAQQAFMIWSLQGWCLSALWGHEWERSRTLADELEAAAVAWSQSGDIRAWAGTAKGIALLAVGDYEGALDSARVALVACDDPGQRPVCARNLKLIEQERPWIGIRSGVEVVSPYLLLGVEEGEPDVQAARLRQVRRLGHDNGALLTLNIAAERALNSRLDEWVRLPAIREPWPMHGLTWTIPRRTRPIGEPDLEEIRNRAWESVRARISGSISLKVGDTWRTRQDLACERDVHG